MRRNTLLTENGIREAQFFQDSQYYITRHSIQLFVRVITEDGPFTLRGIVFDAMKKIRLFIIASLAAVSFSCASVQIVRENTWEFLEENQETIHLYPYPNDVCDADRPKPEKFLFLRLYNTHVKHNIGTAILKKGLAYTNRHEVNGNHIAIGFDLTDSFYGLTLYAKPNLKKEQCTDVSTNEFMKTCDPDKSLQTTFAIPVSQKEYDLAAEWLRYKCEVQNTEYSVSDNFVLAGVALRRKTNPNAKKAKRPQTQEEEFKEFAELNKFVCSTFVCHILYSSVDYIRDYMNENLIDPDYAMPTDIIVMPGVQRLFTSTWNDYSIAAEQFAALYPEFAVYLQ